MSAAPAHTPPQGHEARVEELLELFLAHEPFPGWSGAGLAVALRAAGRDPAEGAIFFPAGGADLLAEFAALIDRRLTEAARAIEETRLSRRIRALVLARFALLRPYREAVRRAASHFLRPGERAKALLFLARRADLFWRLAGDRAVNFSWYTKRAELAAIYGASLLVWLDDPSEDDARTAAFLDRRLAGVARLGQARAALTARLGALRPGRLGGGAVELPRMAEGGAVSP